MTGSEGERLPLISRVDVLRVAGMTALTDRDYYALVGYLVARGLVVEPILEHLAMPASGQISEGSADEAASAETEMSPASLTQWDLELFTSAAPSSSRSGASVWNALHTTIDRISDAKRYTEGGAAIPPEEWKDTPKLRFLAPLGLRRVEGVIGDPVGRNAVDLHSLYETLRVALSTGGYRHLQELRPFPGLGSHGISFLAAYVNEKLKPEKRLPLYEDEKSLDPLPPRERRIIRQHSDYVLRVDAQESDESAVVVSRDQVHDYVMYWGGANGSTGRLLEIFQSLAEQCLTDNVLEPPVPGSWVNESVYYVRKHRAERSGNEFDVWAVRLEKFIDLIYRLEDSAEFRKKVRGYGLEFRKLVRLYLTEVAPYVSEIER